MPEVKTKFLAKDDLAKKIQEVNTSILRQIQHADSQED